MEFNLPTTKEEMFNTLNELFHYYRVKRATYDGVVLKELSLKRLAYTEPDDEDLKERAAILVAPDQRRETDQRKSAIENEITSLTAKIKAAEENVLKLVADAETLYEESKVKLERQARKNGLINSGIYLNEINGLETEKNNKILEIKAENDDEVATLSAALAAQNELLEGCESYFETAHAKDVEKKFAELCEERERTATEVFKYNDGLDEKEQRYKNTILQANANLELKFLEISSGEFTKDQLITMGYYQDVIDCVCGYYNRLSALAAYQDFNADTKLPIYLDDYYQNVLYMYQAKAGL